MARIADASTLTAIAHAAKGHWGYPAAWIRRWRDELTLTPEYLRRHEVHVAEVDGSILGFYALVRGPDGCALDHLWIQPAAMGRGLGRTLWQHAVRRGRALGCVQLSVDADPNAASFYERMGARRVGEVDATVDGVPRVRPQYAVDLR